MDEKAKDLVNLQHLEFASRRQQVPEVHNRENAIEQLRSRIGSQLLRQYDHKKRRYGASSIVPIRGNLCSGCQISLSLGTRRRAYNTITECEHCSRLLYNPSRRRRLKIEIP